MNTIFFLILTLLFFSPRAFAQPDQEMILQLENRVANLENYIDELTASMNQQLQFINNKTIKIDLFSKDFQAVNTNSGIFLVSVDSVKQEGAGYKFGLKIGNISPADYTGFKLRLRWGKEWTPQLFKTLTEWRNSLQGLEYSFNGKLPASSWTTVDLTVTPAEWEQLRYAELEMDVASVELISQ